MIIGDNGYAHGHTCLPQSTYAAWRHSVPSFGKATMAVEVVEEEARLQIDV